MVKPTTMLRALSATTLVTLLAFAGAKADGPAAAAPVKPEATAKKEALGPAPVREVSINTAREVAECHRYRPTGSHIAVMRCVAKVDPDSPRAVAEQALLKSDIDEIRRRQLLQQQLRQQALADALSRLH